MAYEKEHEAANLLLPIQNTAKVIAQYDGLAGPTTQAIGLPTHFGNPKNHFYTVSADGGKLYVALSTSPTGTINPFATSATAVPTAVGWPVADGDELHGTVIGGRPVGMTGPPTGSPTFIHYDYLLYRTASGVGSAVIHVRRSSVQQAAGVEEFHPPGYKRGHYQMT